MCYNEIRIYPFEAGGAGVHRVSGSPSGRLHRIPPEQLGVRVGADPLRQTPSLDTPGPAGQPVWHLRWAAAAAVTTPGPSARDSAGAETAAAAGGGCSSRGSRQVAAAAPLDRQLCRRCLLVGDGDVAAASLHGRQGRLHGEDAVLGEGRLDHLRVGALRQQELPVVLAVDAPAIRLLLVLGVDLPTNRGGAV